MMLVVPLVVFPLCHAVIVASVNMDRMDEHLMATVLIQTSVVGPRASNLALVDSEPNVTIKGSKAGASPSNSSQPGKEEANETVKQDKQDAGKQDAGAEAKAKASEAGENSSIQEPAPSANETAEKKPSADETAEKKPSAGEIAEKPKETSASEKADASGSEESQAKQSNSTSKPSQSDGSPVQETNSSQGAVPQKTSDSETSASGSSAEPESASASEAAGNGSTPEEPQPAEPAVAKDDSSSEEVETQRAREAAASAREASSTVLGWTPDDNATAAVNYASSYDLQNSRGSVLLWTMAATYGALTVLALLVFMICADRQKHAAQLQAEKAFAARNAMPGPML